MVASVMSSLNLFSFDVFASLSHAGLDCVARFDFLQRMLFAFVVCSALLATVPAVCKLSLHRVLAASLVVSAKFVDDIYYSNQYYSKVCGLIGPPPGPA